jgi:hypothetical protein
MTGIDMGMVVTRELAQFLGMFHLPATPEVVALTPEHSEACLNVISPNAFYMLVGDALVSGKPLSVVRMGDGERTLFRYALDQFPDRPLLPSHSPVPEAWLEKQGCLGITCGELLARLRYAAEHASYFAPNVVGLQQEAMATANLFRPRERYVDNWFVHAWDSCMQQQLLQRAGHVLVIHRYADIREQFAVHWSKVLGTRVDGLGLGNWRDTDAVIACAHANSAPLVLFAGGPAGKYIAPMIASDGSKYRKIKISCSNLMFGVNEALWRVVKWVSSAGRSNSDRYGRVKLWLVWG